MTSESVLDHGTALARFGRGLRWIGRAELHLAVIAFAFVAGLTFYQVILRYAFAGSIWWAQEVAQLAMLVSYFFGIAYVYKANQDIVILMIVERLPAATQLTLYLAIQALIVLFCLVVFAQGVLLAPSQLNFRTYILNIPKFYSTLPLLLASLSMAATAVYFGLCAWRHWRQAATTPILAELEGKLTLLHDVRLET